MYGFFWTDCPGASLVLVTTAGLELYNVLASRNGLQLTDAKRQAVSWYRHTHQSRVVLLASGDRCTKISGELVLLGDRPLKTGHCILS